MTDPWKRRVEIGDCVLYEGDCLEIMPTLGGVDAVVTDPPYLLHPTSRATHNPLKRGYIDEIQKKGFSGGLECTHLFCAPHVVSFCSKRQIKDYIIAAEGAGYIWTIICWHKNNPTPLVKRNYLPDTEYIFHMWRDVELRGSYETKRKWYVTDVQKTTIEHPTVKPLNIVTNLVINCSGEGDVVLDCYMGSGTTGVACVNLGRKFIGIELDPGYFDIAVKRIEEAYKQPRLFDEPLPKPVQERML